MSVSRLELQVAEGFGRMAARNGTGIRSCPYAAGGDPDQRVLAARWVRAYVGAGGHVGVDLPPGDDDQADNGNGDQGEDTGRVYPWVP